MDSERFYVAVIGASGVGKSTLAYHLSETIGATESNIFRGRAVFEELKMNAQEEPHRLRERVRSYHGFIIMCDLSSKYTFNDMMGFVSQLRYAKEGMDFPCVIVGNKSDLAIDGKRQVTLMDLLKFSSIWLNRCPVMEISAKERKNVDESFNSLMEEIKISLRTNTVRRASV